MVMAQSLFQSLHRQYPETVLDVLAPRWTLPLTRFMPEVSGGIALPLGHGELGLAERYRIGRDLRARSYDLALVLPGSLKSALVPFFAGIGMRRGFGGALRRLLLTEAGEASPAPGRDLPRPCPRWGRGARAPPDRDG
jgi:ADP-heptose:LPS heptosyltransferase